MTPEMWLDLGPSHTVLDTAFPQIANPSGIQRGVALLLHWHLHSTLENACLPPCGLGTTVGWVGVPKFLSGLLFAGRLAPFDKDRHAVLTRLCRWVTLVPLSLGGPPESLQRRGQHADAG